MTAWLSVALGIAATRYALDRDFPQGKEDGLLARLDAARPGALVNDYSGLRQTRISRRP
jgi:hypothetical protein